MPKTATRVDVDALVASLLDDPGDDDVEGRVLAAASGLLLERGLAGLEVDQVAERSGVGRSTVYRRFDDRNGLLTATVAHEARRFLALLAGSVAEIDDTEEQVVAAFALGLRLVRDGDFGSLLRSEPLLLQLLTVDSGPIVAAARDQLVAEAARREPGVDPARGAGAAEMLIRLAISFVLSPATALDLRDKEIEASVRRHIAPLVRDARRSLAGAPRY
ncbi:MAG: TetR family transcriptional regulator [Acidimicrobiales bacterium]|nr:TetR family transcriptional regulator [Acidimicrobiales bacterium]